MQYIEKPLSAIEQIFLDMSRSARLSGLVRTFGPAPALLGEDATERVRNELAWLRAPQGGNPIRAVAHCLCGF